MYFYKAWHTLQSHLKVMGKFFSVEECWICLYLQQTGAMWKLLPSSLRQIVHPDEDKQWLVNVGRDKSKLGV